VKVTRDEIAWEFGKVPNRRVYDGIW